MMTPFFSVTTMNFFQSIPFPYLYNKKAKHLGLWLIWLWGFILIGVSFYATQLMPFTSSFKGQIKKTMLFNGELVDSPTITIFTAPKPFVATVGERQALAIRSWIGLSPDISVVLFSQDPSVFSFAESLSHRVSVEPNIDFTFLGTPFFHSMVARSKASSSDVSVVIDPDTILLPDFIKTIRHAHKLDHDWLLFSSSKSVPHFPFRLDADGKHWLRDDGSRVKTQKLQDFLSQEWKWNLCEGKMLIAWNNGDLPLHKGVLPPFLYGKGLHNRWLINEALLSDFRFVFDATWAISNLHLNDLDHDFNRASEDFLGQGAGKRFWEVAGNSDLAMLYGSLYFHEQNFSNIFRLFQCRGCYLFINPAQMVVYPLRYKGSLSLRKEVMSMSTREKNTLECVDTIRSTEGAKDCSVKDYMHVSMPISLSLSLEILLSLRADKNKTVVLAVVGYNYKDMLMSWVCRLYHLQISNFLVCALDDDIYDFSILQGLPVFKYANLETKISFDNCHFGTECFQKVTKVKSRMVLQILKLGYNVLMSDVDIYWFKNPLPLLSSFGPAVLVAQSDEYKLTGPINLPRRLNSGFYYAHSDAMTIAAIDKVVKHAASSNLSEQPSFYDTLCGEGGCNRIDDSRCLEPQTNLTVQFLDRDLFPNGAYKDLWKERSVKEACLMKDCFIIHNNWISGRRKKLERQVSSGLWEYDMSTRMCLQTWHKTKFLCGNKSRQGQNTDKESERRKKLKETDSFSLSLQLKDITVRIVHPGGKVDMYECAISAAQLLKNYPGRHVALPDFFKRPHESLLTADDILLPGQKYLVIPASTVEKLKHRHSHKAKHPTESEEPKLDREEVVDVSGDCLEDSICFAKDFYASKERWSGWLWKKRKQEKKPFVPPIPTPKPWRDSKWEPNLNSIEEISP